MPAGNNKDNESKFTDEQVKKLSARIIALRKAGGYASAESFSYAHNINRTQYARYEKGQNLRFASLVRVVKALNITMAEFFSEGFD